jgi:hypothetical protein
VLKALSTGLEVRLLCALLLGLAGSECSAQKVFRCELPDQSTAFSDRPCGAEATVVDLGTTNRAAAATVDKERWLRQRRAGERKNISGRRAGRGRRASQDIACGRARDRLLSLQERWRTLRRAGYTPGQQRDYEQRIRESERSVDTVCG